LTDRHWDGAGSKIYDVDGTEYVDMHGGYGASIAGHAHLAIVAAVSQRVCRGTHFAQPTEDATKSARENTRTQRPATAESPPQ